MNVSLLIGAVIALLDDFVVHSSMTGQKISTHEVRHYDIKVVVVIYEKHFCRVKNRLTLRVRIDKFTGVTRVHHVGAGGEGLFRFDFGAGKSFRNIVASALSDYII